MTPLAVTMGEPAGIGAEIVLKAWAGRRQSSLPVFFVLDDPERLSALATDLGIAAAVQPIGAARDAAAVFDHALPVLPVALREPVRAGQPSAANAPAVINAIDRAIDLVQSGEAAAIVTNPIHKHTLYAAGFPDPGHTEYLARRCGAATHPVMMLACPGFRAVPVTVHLALRLAIEQLTTEAIVLAGTVLATALVGDFGVVGPRIAVAGLNPHAGESGALGSEEDEVIAPAVARLREAGVDAAGPMPADSMFHEEARAGYDAALCMYHDQALIPAKTISFHQGINVTLGLPVVRTSPDHGAALAIAGSGRARPDSLVAAILAAADIAGRRASAAGILDVA